MFKSNSQDSLMAFNNVYRSLLELFPQVDSRALRAVAIEHWKDLDAAVEAVLEDIIPVLMDTSAPIDTPLNQTVCVAQPEAALSDAIVGTQTEDGPSASITGVARLQNNHNVDFDLNEPCGYAYDGHHEVEDDNNNNNTSESMRISANVPSRDETACIDSDATDTLQTQVSGGGLETEEEIISGDRFSDGIVDGQDLDTDIHQILNLVQEGEGTAVQLETGFGNNENYEIVGHLQSSVSLDEPTMSESSQSRIVELVEKIIQEASDDKKKIFSAMESVMSLMRQVGLKEQAVEQAKEAAEIGGKNTLEKVEELKKMLQHAKETNDMHGGEVYGEKSILGTELRELQSRVLSLSDEKETSLSILDEMRQTLEVRLVEAENEIQSAEHKKLEKETAAQKLLADQELIMEKVVQDSKILKQQAEDNAKLEEFLLDRGRVVDMLQGEIAVICQDVRVLKEKFDEHVPLSKSVFSNQTSFILASSSSNSSSSSINLNAEQVGSVPVGDDGLLDETRKKSDLTEQVSTEKANSVNQKALSDDGWEFLDDQ